VYSALLRVCVLRVLCVLLNPLHPLHPLNPLNPPDPPSCAPAPNQVLEEELKKSYSTKNYSLRHALLELEKTHRQQIGSVAAVAALWADVAYLLVGVAGGCVVGGIVIEGVACISPVHVHIYRPHSRPCRRVPHDRNQPPPTPIQEDKGQWFARYSASNTPIRSPRASDAEDEPDAGPHHDMRSAGSATHRASTGGGAGDRRGTSPGLPRSPMPAGGMRHAADDGAAVPALSALFSECVLHLHATGVLGAQEGVAAAGGGPSPQQLEAALHRFLATDQETVPQLLRSMGGTRGAAAAVAAAGGKPAVNGSAPQQQQQQQQQPKAAAGTPPRQREAASTPEPQQQQQQQQQQDPQQPDPSASPLLPPLPVSPGDAETALAASGVVYAGSGAELTVAKVSVGQSLDLLSALDRHLEGGGDAEELAEGMEALQIKMVRPEDLTDMDSAAKGEWVGWPLRGGLALVRRLGAGGAGAA
jgi:hypothetical protein